MESKLTSLLFSFFFFLFLSHLSLSSSLEFQPFFLTTLPSPSSLSPDLAWTESTQPESHVDGLTSSPSVTFHLEHVDALLPPNLTSTELFSLRLTRDKARFESLSARARGHGHKKHGGFSSPVVSGVPQGTGEYFTRFGVGTPPRYMYMELDTGSDITWFQCLPCRKCYNQTDRIFNPAQSHSYGPIPCDSKICHKLDTPGCVLRSKRCAYQVAYGDKSFTLGELATETLTFKGTKIPNVAIGCGHDNEGLFTGAAGLIGLGQGKLSFPSQTRRRFGSKFSYCLGDRYSSSKRSWITFGNKAVSRDEVFTPMIINQKLDTFYYVEMVGLSVGGTRVPGITSKLFKIDSTGDGGVVVDSGTSVTRLTQLAYVRFRDAFRARASYLKRAAKYSMFDTCYDLKNMKTQVPTIVMHFKGADVDLPVNNYMIPVDTSGRYCFAFAGTKSKLSIIGNIQQQGFRVSFDMSRHQVGFAPGACA